jgi:hypothetical protein
MVLQLAKVSGNSPLGGGSDPLKAFNGSSKGNISERILISAIVPPNGHQKKVHQANHLTYHQHKNIHQVSMKVLFTHLGSLI